MLNLLTCSDTIIDTKQIYKPTETDKYGQILTEADGNGQKWGAMDRNGQKQTKMDRNGEEEKNKYQLTKNTYYQFKWRNL